MRNLGKLKKSRYIDIYYHNRYFNHDFQEQSIDKRII